MSSLLANALKGYNALNLHGKLQDRYLDEATLYARGQQQLAALGQQRAYRPAQAVDTWQEKVGDAARRVQARTNMVAASTLYVNRSAWVLEVAPGHLGSLLRLPLPPLQGLAELTLGRGTSSRREGPVAIGARHAAMPAFFRPTWAMFQTFSSHGLLGTLLEAAPLKASAVLRAEGYHSAAACCVLAAALGRLLLLPTRLFVFSVMAARLQLYAGCYVLGAIALGAALQKFAAAGRGLGFSMTAVDGLQQWVAA